MHGVQFDLFSGGFFRYDNGAYQGGFVIGNLVSPGTSHWPFQLFDCKVCTGPRASFTVTVLGLTVGNTWVHDTDEQGAIKGSDYRKLYCMFSCINHQHQHFEEII